MFVKIIHPFANCENLFECDSVNVLSHLDHNDIVTLVLHKNNQILSEWEIDKTTADVYFMNNEGKTIDSWHWPKSNSKGEI